MRNRGIVLAAAACGLLQGGLANAQTLSYYSSSTLSTSTASAYSLYSTSTSLSSYSSYSTSTMSSYPSYYNYYYYTGSGYGGTSGYGGSSGVTIYPSDSALTVLYKVLNDPYLDYRRKRIIQTAYNEYVAGWAGTSARSRYQAAGTGAWCTEFAAFVYRNSYTRNISYCATSLFGYCLSYVYLHSAKNFDAMHKLFRVNYGLVEGASALYYYTPKAGDWMGLNLDGIPGVDHSTIVLGVSYDLRWVYTIEGNNGDRIQVAKYPYIQYGTVNPQIGAIGKISVALY